MELAKKLLEVVADAIPQAEVFHAHFTALESLVISSNKNANLIVTTGFSYQWEEDKELRVIYCMNELKQLAWDKNISIIKVPFFFGAYRVGLLKLKLWWWKLWH